MPRETDIAEIRELLQRRRRDILELARATHAGVTALQEQERDPEYEENAQIELADYTLAHLAENQRRELVQIDGALARIDAGQFGRCIDCGEQISMRRLKAVPFALRCEEDAAEREATLREKGSAAATPSL